jgi:hypothetical protein
MIGVSPLEHSTGLEDLAFGAFGVLFQNLNDEIAEVESSRAERDEAIAALRGLSYEPVELERVEDDHFYLGHVPSLILDETPLDNYPAVSVMSYRAQPEAFDSQLDQQMALRDLMYVEVLVKASPAEGEEVCDRRIWRTCDAVNRTLMKNQTLNGAAFGLGQSPTVIISEVFTRPRSDTDDRDWFWQAGRIEYGVTKFSPFA